MTKDNNLLGTFNLSGIPPAPRGVPQIEVTFDIDANGILNVSAADKSTGKSEKITIKNDKGRLSKEEIERMLADAEKYKKEDEMQQERVKARNQLEAYLFGVKQAVQDAPADKINETEKQQVLDKCNENLKWLDNNALADKEEYEDRLKELEKECQPIMMKMHGGGGAGAAPGGGAGFPGFPGGFPGGATPNGFPGGAGPGPQPSSGPTVEEVD